MITTSAIDTTNNSNHASREQDMSSLYALPGDIVLEIFAHLSKQDCLTCMAVCRDWYNNVPEYTRNVWKELRLSINILSNHGMIERFLGNHVKKLVIEPQQQYYSIERVEEMELHTLLQKAVSWGCTEIESIELIRCVTTHLDPFLDSLRKLTPRITCLEMTEHVCGVGALHVLHALPRLTHFTCQYSDHPADQRTFVARSLKLPEDYYSNITHLRLDTRMLKHDKELILERCPNLRCYIDTSIAGKFETGTVDLDFIFTRCPMISVLHVNFIGTVQDPDVYIKGKHGLRLFNISTGHRDDEVARYLANSQHTLEFLSISRGYDWSQVLQALQMPNLRIFLSNGNSFSTNFLVTLLNHCSALETLDLYLPRRLALDASAIASIPTMHHLKSLILGNIVLDDGLSLFTLLQRFPLLEKLVLRRMPLYLKLPTNFESASHLKHLELPEALWKDDGIDNTEREASIANFIKCLTGKSKLETIQLAHVPMPGYKPLLTLAVISTLKSLDVQIDRALHSDGLLEFINTLRKAAITTLTLRYIGSLSFTVLGALAELPLLQIFCMKRIISSKSITRVSKSGLQQVLRRSTRLKSISFENYTVIEEGGKQFNHKQLLGWIKTQVPKSSQFTARPEYWEMTVDRYGIPEIVLRDITISRVST